jgi:hypothetical protein
MVGNSREVTIDVHNPIGKALPARATVYARPSGFLVEILPNAKFEAGGKRPASMAR